MIAHILPGTKNHYLIPQLTVFDNILLTAQVNRKSKKDTDNINDLFKYFNLTHIVNQYPSEISGGESQRVAFIRSIVNKPKIVIADEPTGNLDLDNTYKLMEVIEAYIKDFGITFIIATHDSLIRKKSNRQLYIEKGKLI